jgi:hypothetical protein
MGQNLVEPLVSAAALESPERRCAGVGTQRNATKGNTFDAM